jgi:hypothetical protein
MARYSAQTNNLLLFGILGKRQVLRNCLVRRYAQFHDTYVDKIIEPPNFPLILFAINNFTSLLAMLSNELVWTESALRFDLGHKIYNRL